jgi:hypothetical protein
MIKRNITTNSTFLGDFLLLVVTILSSSILAMPSTPIAPSLSSIAFASHGDGYTSDRSIFDIAIGSNNNNQAGGEEHGGLIDNIISQQQSPQAYAGNVNEDNKMIIVENCEDGEVIINDNDKIIQTNTQSFSQEANNQVGGEEVEDDWGLIGNLISQQQSPQAYAGNVNEDNKMIIVENCEDGEVIINDNDKIIQTNTQSFSQEANNQVGGEEVEEEDEDS